MTEKTRQIALDTETTGLDPLQGHRVIEIGAVEIINRRVTENYFHCYINPQREIDAGAVAVHGITNDFLEDKPLFHDVVDDFIAFIGNDDLVIHNAAFDVKFLNHEFKLCHSGLAKVDKLCHVIDTLILAREKHPGQRNNLDALCKRYDVDNAHRELHGALLDARLLAFVYLAMTGGQESLFDSALEQQPQETQQRVTSHQISPTNLAIISANEEELLAHEAYLEKLNEKNGEPCVWQQFK